MEGLESFFTSTQQLNLFLISCVFGIPIGVFFDIFRTLRILFKHGKIAVIIEDILFFIIYGIFIMCFTITAARSEFRFYYCFGNLLGFILYYVTVGHIVVSFLRTVILKIKKILQKPIRKFTVLCLKVTKKIEKNLQTVKIRKKFKKPLD
ncbi:MAG: spore cortex biosynthesis protein YabQ [Oscillospiraceae bacterium]|nr:spore cortex biosynthesis protein YabQ [Oscillospiraceae bacterium]